MLLLCFAMFCYVFAMCSDSRHGNMYSLWRGIRLSDQRQPTRETRSKEAKKWSHEGVLLCFALCLLCVCYAFAMFCYVFAMFLLCFAMCCYALLCFAMFLLCFPMFCYVLGDVFLSTSQSFFFRNVTCSALQSESTELFSKMMRWWEVQKGEGTPDSLNLLDLFEASRTSKKSKHSKA